MHGRVVILLLSAVTLVTALAARAEAVRPAMAGPDLVSGRTSTGDGGNAWGGHQPRIVRTARGVFTVYSAPSGRGMLHRNWRLAHQTTAGWRVIASGEAGREPPSLVAAADGTLYVVAWPSGLPRLWTISAEDGGWQVTSQLVPGDWFRSDWAYGTAAISPAGDLYVLEGNQVYSDPKPQRGQLRLARRDHATGTWSSRVTATPYRYLYAWILPDDKGITVVATRAAHWGDLGFVRPRGAFPWAYNAIGVWRAKGGSVALTSAGLIRVEHQTARYRKTFLSAAQPGVYEDSEDRVHVLYLVRGPSTKGVEQLRHAVLVDGRVVADVRLPTTMGYARVTEDAAGRLYVFGAQHLSHRLYVYPAKSPDATSLDKPTVLSLGRYSLNDASFAMAEPRSGTPRSQQVDVAYASGARAQRWVHFALTLSAVR